MGDTEGIALTIDLVEVFKKAGWTLPGSGFSQSVFNGLPKGVIIRLHSAEDQNSPSVKVLTDFLARAGIERSGEVDTKVPAGQFRILVGARP